MYYLAKKKKLFPIFYICMSSSAQDTLRLPFLFQEIFPFPLSPEQGVQPVCQASFHLPPHAHSPPFLLLICALKLHLLSFALQFLVGTGL